MSRLTTTSYTLLGHLHLRPWSAYELTRRMRHTSTGSFWSRTPSRLYEEPKNLVRHGLANCSTEQHGGRRRTIYTITTAGRTALETWLSEPTAPLTTEFEAMLKVIFSDAGSRMQVRRNIQRVREQAGHQAVAIKTLAHEVSDLSGQFPERAPIAALACRFLAGLVSLQIEWAEWAEEFVAGWPTDGTSDHLDARARQVLKDSVRVATRATPPPSRTTPIQHDQAPRSSRLSAGELASMTSDWAPWS